MYFQIPGQVLFCEALGLASGRLAKPKRNLCQQVTQDSGDPVALGPDAAVHWPGDGPALRRRFALLVPKV